MALRPDPSIPARPPASPRRRRWPWLLLVPVLAATALALAAPWLTCRIINGRSPLPAGGLLIRGAMRGGEPPAAMVVGTCDPATFRAICQGASGRWIPPLLLADGQHSWGTFSDAPEVTWRLDLTTAVDTPSVEARVPTHVAETVFERGLVAGESPVSHPRIASLELLGQPTEPGTTGWTLHLAGGASVALGRQALPVTIDELRLTASSRLIDAVDGNRSVHGEIAISELRGKAPLLGDLAPLIRILEKQANQRLGQELPKTLVPGWWPTATRWDLRTVPGAMTEF